MGPAAACLDADTLRLHLFPCLAGCDVARCSCISLHWCGAQSSPELWRQLCSAAGCLEDFAGIKQVEQPKDTFRSYVEAMDRWRKGQPSSVIISGEALLWQGIGEDDRGGEGDDTCGPRDVTSLLCGLCLEGCWLVLAFNGGVVQFWELPAARCCSKFAVPTNILEIDFDLKGQRLAVCLASHSVAIYDCSHALAASGLVELPLLSSFTQFPAVPQHIAFWGPGVAVATKRCVMVLGPMMEVAYCAEDSIFWDMGKSFLLVKQQDGQVHICHWVQDGVEVEIQRSHDASAFALLSCIEGQEGCPPKLLCEREGRLSLRYPDTFGDDRTADAWVELRGLQKLAEIVVPVVMLDGGVRIVQAVPGQGLFCEETRLCAGTVLSTDFDTLVAGEICSPDANSPSTAFLTYVEPIAVGHFELMLLQIPGPAQTLRLGLLDLGSDEDVFMETAGVLSAVTRRFLAVSDVAGIHIFDFCREAAAPDPGHARWMHLLLACSKRGLAERSDAKCEQG
mmetsp:Transcript_57662/g.159494  ORF Transcript_57662/g.159494 Transcript_57662/m.159494 type:complete len:508 (+) Transcript_57662:41-1564(+)